MVTFYVIRHGETEANRDGVFQGQTDVPLSDRGRRQASLAALALAGIRFDAVYSSDLSRAAETARAIMEHQTCSLVFDRRLRELHGGKLQGLTWDEAAARYPQFDEAFRKDPVNTRRPGGESFADLRERVARAIRDIYEWNAEPGGATVAVIGHGGVIHSILEMAGVDAELMEHVVGNCTITVLRRDKDGWASVKIGDAAHLAAMETDEEE
jgi:probable phosphoglycerate mutase